MFLAFSFDLHIFLNFLIPCYSSVNKDTGMNHVYSISSDEHSRCIYIHKNLTVYPYNLQLRTPYNILLIIQPRTSSVGDFIFKMHVS